MAFVRSFPLVTGRRGAPHSCGRIATRGSATTPPPPLPPAAAAASTASRKVVLYDGVCGLCNGGIQFLLRVDRQKKLKYAALQSDAGLRLLEETGAPQDLSTVVYVDGKQAYTYSDAVLRIGEELDLPLAAAAAMGRLLVPRGLRDSFYTDVVANNRYRVFGRSESCTLSQPGYEDRFLK